MRRDVYTPILLSLPLTAVSPLVGRRVAPALAARVLTASAVFTAAATTWSLDLLAVTLVNQAPLVVADARDDGRRIPEPVPAAIAVTAVLGLVLVAVRVHRAAHAERVTRRTLRTLCAGHPPDTELVVAASPVAQAFAIPGRGGAPGRILVTSAMLSALDPAERRVLLAPRARPSGPSAHAPRARARAVVERRGARRHGSPTTRSPAVSPPSRTVRRRTCGRSPRRRSRSVPCRRWGSWTRRGICCGC